MSDAKESETPAQEVATSEGKRARRAFMPRLLIDQEWINKNVVSQGKGTKIIAGRMFGMCTKTEEKTNRLPNGEQSISIVMTGMFRIENGITGEVSDVTQAYLPMAFAEQVAQAFAVGGQEVKAVEVDVDIGCEATGKTIPYEWLVISHLDGVASNFLNRMRERRPRAATMGKVVPLSLAAPGPIIDATVERIKEPVAKGGKAA